jgi:hypothetical protein
MAVENIREKHIDKYLTNFATRYKQGESVADFIAPPFKVKKSSDKYLEWTKRDLRLYDNKVGRREPAKEIDLEADESTYSCEEYALAGFVYDRDEQNVDRPIKLREETTMRVKDAQMAAREKRVYDIAGSTSFVTNYTAIGGDWDNTSSGTPVADMLTGMVEIEKASGKKANACVMTYEVALNLIRTDEWKNYFKYTWGMKSSGDGLFDAVAGLRHLGLEPRISGVRGLSTYDGTGSDPAMETIWGDSVLLFYREAAPTTQSMTFMFSPFTKKDQVRKFRKDEERGWKIQIEEDIDELLVSADCAYLLTNTL